MNNTDRMFLRKRKGIVRQFEKLEKKQGSKVVRSAMRRHLENVRAEERLEKGISQAKSDLRALRRKKRAGR